MKYQAIINPVVTEKAARAQERGVYTFTVRKDVTKIDIKQAFEKMYGVKVKKVQVISVKPKTRLIGRGRTIQKRKKMKKAILTVEGDGKKLDLFKFEKTKEKKK